MFFVFVHLVLLRDAHLRSSSAALFRAALSTEAWF